MTYTGLNLDRAALQSQVDAIEAQNQQADAFRICPRCGGETFTQRPVRGRPADVSSPRT